VVALVSGALVLVCALIVVAIGMSNRSPQTPTAAPTPAAAAATGGRSTAPAASPTASKAAAASSSAPAMVAMPKLVGLNAAVARDQLDKLGFTNIQLGSQDAEDTVVILASNWTVTKQSTAAGAQVSTDTLIVLTCTKKP
jgi:hypothetical protein